MWCYRVVVVVGIFAYPCRLAVLGRLNDCLLCIKKEIMKHEFITENGLTELLAKIEQLLKENKTFSVRPALILDDSNVESFIGFIVEEK